MNVVIPKKDKNEVENFFAEFYQEYKRPLGLLIFATDYF